MAEAKVFQIRKPGLDHGIASAHRAEAADRLQWQVDSLQRKDGSLRQDNSIPRAKKWAESESVKFLTHEYGVSERLALYHRKHPVRAKLLAVGCMLLIGALFFGASHVAPVTDLSRY